MILLREISVLQNEIDILHHCKELNLEICAFQLETKMSNLIILSVYKGPSDDCSAYSRVFLHLQFLKWL